MANMAKIQDKLASTARLLSDEKYRWGYYLCR